MPDILRSAYNRLHTGLNHRLRRVAGGKFASYCRPACPLVLLTELCNARCVHCDIWKNRGREDSPTVDHYKTFLTDLRKWLGPIHLVFTGGEALLKPFTVDLVAHASALGLRLEILTHGYWEDQTKVEKLVLAKPWRVTISVDGVGDVHTRIRGRDKFWERTYNTIETVKRVRRDSSNNTRIRLKNVIMSHNLDQQCDVLRLADEPGVDVFFQPIEQNYNTPEDAAWWKHSDNWPRDAEEAVGVVTKLIQMKREGHPVANSYQQLEVMIPYFRNPDALRLATQAHQAHERRQKLVCSALSMLQIQANGDVTACTAQGPIGNIKTTRIADIWRRRPRWWESGCCLGRRLTAAEKAAAADTV